MNSISRFFAPKKSPASAKATANKKDTPKSTSGKAAAAAGSPSSFDSMEEAPHKEKNSAQPMPRSALKKSKTIALSDGVQLQAVATRRPSANAQEANKSFDGHYGDNKGQAAEAAPRQAKAVFKEDVVKDFFNPPRYPYELPHINGKVASMHAKALKYKVPVLGFDDHSEKVLVWPSGHTYRGTFERGGKKPGPLGELTLPSGYKVKAWFKDGSCYLAKNDDGEVIEPHVDKLMGDPRID